MSQTLKLLFTYILSPFLLLNFWVSSAQSDFLLNAKVSEKIPFEFTNNLIIFPIEINGVELSFVLDTGVNKPILFNLTEHDSLSLKDTKTFYLHGLGGDGKIEALKSSHNRFKIGNAINTNQDLFVVFDKTINFTPRLGVLVHGIIGYDVFKNFVVEINYNSKYIRLHKPGYFKPKTSKKWTTLPINLNRGKAYIDGKVNINNIEKPVKLLIDTGSSDALWLFEDKAEGLTPKKDYFFVDYLGKGLSGSVYGKRSKVEKFTLDAFNLEHVNVAYPDSSSIDLTKVYKGRNGSLGGDILKRFNYFFDYRNEKLYLKKNGAFKAPFTYNNSGIVLEYNGNMFVEERIKIQNSNFTNTKRMDAVQIDYSFNSILTLKPAYRIVEIRSLSNAYKAGLRKGDVLLTINAKEAYNYKLQEISGILHGRTGRTIRMKIDRNGESMAFKFKLDDVFKTNEPSN
jgi:hypothetical protein